MLGNVFFILNRAEPSSEEIRNILDMLSDFSDEFDLTSVLSMLPDDWSVQMVSSVLQRAMRKSLHRVIS